MTGECLREIVAHSKFKPCVSASRWDVDAGALLQIFRSHANDVMDVACSHDGKWTATPVQTKQQRQAS